MNAKVILGIDIGTSGVRGTLVRVTLLSASQQSSSSNPMQRVVLASEKVSLDGPKREPEMGKSVQSPALWIDAIERLVAKLSAHAEWEPLEHIIVDATSSTVLLCNGFGQPLLPDAMMYDDRQATVEAQQIDSRLQQEGVFSGAQGPSSTLAKVLFMLNQLSEAGPLAGSAFQTVQLQTNRVQICHQIDFVNHWLLHGASQQLSVSTCPTDENNALKLGYDSVNQTWPAWVEEMLQHAASQAEVEIELPKVVRPGSRLGYLADELAMRWGLSSKVQLHAGTTDSMAGFLASGASQQGDGVTSLGSTIAIKLLSDTPIFNPEYGIYSHKLGSYWLVGGASNTGGAVLLKYFDLRALQRTSQVLAECLQAGQIEKTVSDQYYPLLHSGERFPICDPNLPPKLPQQNAPSGTPQDEKNQAFMLALLQGLSHIERLGYQRLQELGAPRLQRVYAVGGGTQNSAWQKLRQIYLEVGMAQPDSLDASFGVTRLVDEFQD